MIAKVYISGVIGEDVKLTDVIRQVNSFAASDVERVEVVIDSVGGYVDEGKAIYNYLTKLGKPVTTYAIKAYSIAAHIFMAGEDRIVERGDDRIMIHFPFVSQMTGRSEDLRKMSEELQALEEEFVSFYGQFIRADEDTIRRLLDTETFLSADDAFTLGIANTIEEPFEMKAVAYLKEEEIKNKNQIMKNAEKLVNALKAFIKGDEAEVKALVLQDANGVEIEFPEVADDAQPSIGDTALVDGSPAEGQYVSPSGEVWVFEGGALTAVNPAEEEEVPMDAEDEEAPAEEETVAEEGAEEEEPEVEAEAEDSELDFEVLLEELFAKAKKELAAETQEMIDSLKAENETLQEELKATKKLLGSGDIEVTPKERKEQKGRYTNSRAKALEILQSRNKK